jgi:hypothetical protein
MRSITTMTTHKKHNGVATDTNNLSLNDVELNLVRSVLLLGIMNSTYESKDTVALKSVCIKIEKALDHINTEFKDD